MATYYTVLRGDWASRRDYRRDVPFAIMKMALIMTFRSPCRPSEQTPSSFWRRLRSDHRRLVVLALSRIPVVYEG
jgi:hypothetical protein